MIKIPQQQERDAFPTSAAGNGSKSHNAKGSVAKPIKTKSSIPKSTGPRTAKGKERSKLNALKSGLFSKAVLLKGESRAEYLSLLNGLRDDLRPEGTLEAVVVEKLAALFWRERRLFQAENAEISQRIEFAESEFRKAEDRWRAELKPDEWLKDLNAVRLTREMQEEIVAYLDNTYNYYLEIKESGDTSEETEFTLQFFEGELKLTRPDLKFLIGAEKSLERADQQGIKRRSSAALIPVQEVSERLLRYETHFGREVDRILNQLERLQKMRKGEPVPPTLNVNVSA